MIPLLAVVGDINPAWTIVGILVSGLLGAGGMHLNTMRSVDSNAQRIAAVAAAAAVDEYRTRVDSEMDDAVQRLASIEARLNNGVLDAIAKHTEAICELSRGQGEIKGRLDGIITIWEKKL